MKVSESVEAELNEEDFYIEDIEKKVSEKNPLIASPSTVNNLYSIKEYIDRGHGVKYNVIIDNNILTRIIALAKGYEISGNEEEIKAYRYCVALMCFFILAEFQIENNVALYERASQNGHEKALEDHDFFTIANHIDPVIYAELALGKTNRITEEQIEYTKRQINIAPPLEPNFAKQLDNWKIVYLNLLKATVLYKNDENKVNSIGKFMEFITNESTTRPGLIVFVLLFLSPKYNKPLIKKINTSDLNVLKDRIKNAAWDLVYINEWRQNFKSADKSTIWFFCTYDQILQEICRFLYLKQDEDECNALKNLIIKFWGKKDGIEVYGFYKEFEKAISSNSEARIKHNRNVLVQGDGLILELEKQLEESI